MSCLQQKQSTYGLKFNHWTASLVARPQGCPCSGSSISRIPQAVKPDARSFVPLLRCN